MSPKTVRITGDREMESMGVRIEFVEKSERFYTEVIEKHQHQL